MLNRLRPRAHGMLDYVTVAVFLLAPWALSLDALDAGISYGLAAAHLILTLVTRFPFGATTILPFKFHGGIELIVGIGLVVMAWALSGPLSDTGVGFFAVMGVLIVAVWAVTRYELTPPPETV